MQTPIQFAVASNEGRSEEVNGSRVVNLFAETLPPDSKSPVVLYGTPGQYLFTSLPTMPVQAQIVMDGLLYVVTSTNLYCVQWDGSYTDLGTIVCAGNVSIATSGFYIVFVNGFKGYAYGVKAGLVEMHGN